MCAFVCVVTAEASSDIQKLRGGRFWVALRKAVHPAIPPTPPLCLWARPDLGPRVSPTDGPLTKEPLGPPSRSPAHPIKSQ